MNTKQVLATIGLVILIAVAGYYVVEWTREAQTAPDSEMGLRD